MRCLDCGLPDPYNGQGDGIGSCDCPRCQCCGAGPQECECNRDFDDLYDDADEPYDYLCNDTSCAWRLGRLTTVRTVLDEPTFAEIAAENRRDDL